MALSVGSVSLGIRIDRTSGQVGGIGFTVRKQELQTGKVECGSEDKLCPLCILMEECKSFWGSSDSTWTCKNVQELVFKNCPITSSDTGICCNFLTMAFETLNQAPSYYFFNFLLCLSLLPYTWETLVTGYFPKDAILFPAQAVSTCRVSSLKPLPPFLHRAVFLSSLHFC